MVQTLRFTIVLFGHLIRSNTAAAVSRSITPPSQPLPKVFDKLQDPHGRYKEMKEANDALRIIVQNLNGEIDALHFQNTALAVLSRDQNQEIHGFQFEMQRLNQDVHSLTSENHSLIASNQRLVDQITTMNQDIDTIHESLRSEQESHQKLKEIHHQMLVIGVIIIGLTLLVLIIVIVFVCRIKGRHKGAKEQDMSHMTVFARSQGIPDVLMDYRPRSRTIEELHHKFGMNDIDKVTAKEGADLVRIGRPLETEGAERKLSEQLLGIDPIICDKNGERKPTNTFDLATGREGEEGAVQLETMIKDSAIVTVDK